MTTTRVFAEIPDFGYGPAASFADLAAALGDSARWTVATTGNAARFLRDAMPEATFADFNGFSPEAWPSARAIAAPDALWLTMSNPRFANWAGARGHPVILVDQLHWMWGKEELGEGRFIHVAPQYFGHPQARLPTMRLTRPILDPTIERYRRPRARRKGTLIAFGGMAIAGDPTAGDAYARWILERALPVVLDATAGAVHVVGGSPRLAELCTPWRNSSRVCVHGRLDRATYLNLLGSTAFQLLTPGLSTIYESAELELSPLFQPGANKSMVLQLEDLAVLAPRRCARWSWAHERVPHLRSVSQVEALAEIAVLLEHSLSPASTERERFAEAVSRYLGSGPAPALKLDRGPDLPHTHVVVDELIRSHTGGAA